MLRLPRKFYDDHAERDLPTPAALKESKRFVWVDKEDPALADLVADAEHYVECRDSFCADSIHWCDAAARLLRTAINAGVAQ